ncbi:spermatogenesis-associated serine-rich protein 1 [Hyperolius riggenbachi]|uniref:spermatogenesis-associated serine-rich protein 1 n=1 Tax=Hyperolius riggenbachi TaxID=752182 RepID=UPI0035A2A70B
MLHDPQPHTDDGKNYNTQHSKHDTSSSRRPHKEKHDKGFSLPLIHVSAPAYPNCDLDWKPSVRWLPSPRYSDAPLPHIKVSKFPDGNRLQRSYPRGGLAAGAEWSFYPSYGSPFTYHMGKRCIIEGVHRSSLLSEHIQALPTCLGRKKRVFDPRNGIPAVQPGDKPFHTVEYSKDFHKFGSTLPVVNFRESFQVKADTFIPLEKLPTSPSVPYRVKNLKNSLDEERRVVKELNSWRPAQRSFLADVPGNGHRIYSE